VPRKKNPWRWSRQRELAAKLIADDQLPDLEIAKRVGVSFVTLYAWKDKPEFAGRIKELVEIHRKAFRDSVFASAAHCAAEIERDYKLLKEVQTERARVYGAEQFKNAIPGGHTGKVAITRYRLVTDPLTGKKQNVPIVAIDTQTEMLKLAMLKQAQQHLGQWEEQQNEGINQALDFLKILDQQMKNGPAKAEEPEEEKKA
jgi:hypothetical protein